MKYIYSLVITMFIASPSFCAELQVKSESKPFPNEQMIAQKNDIAKMVSQEINSTLPQTIDKYTKLVEVTNEESTIVYIFEILTGAKSDESIIKKDRSRMKKAITKGICQSSKKFLIAGINTSYRYINSITKSKLFQFDIEQKDCVLLK